MDDFCCLQEKDEKPPRPTWKKALLGGYLTERTQSEVDEANKQWQKATSLQQEGNEAEAVTYCRDSLWREMQRWLRGSTQRCQSFLMRCSLVHLLRIWSANVDSATQNDHGSSFRSYESLLSQCLAQKLEGNDPESLKTCRVVVCFGLQFLGGGWARFWASKLLVRLEECFGPDHGETASLVQYLAESFVFDDDMFLSSRHSTGRVPRESDQILDRHLLRLDEHSGTQEMSSLCYFYGLGRLRLSHGSQEEARSLLERAFNGRVETFGESHDESDPLIGELLDGFCAKRSGKYNTRSDVDDPHALITDLVAHCYETERFAEAEVLVDECLSHDGVFEVTGAENPPFWLAEGSAQHLLASHGAPGKYIFWEDARTYLRRWAAVTLVPASPLEFFPVSPVQVTVGPDDIDMDLSSACLHDLRDFLGFALNEEILKEMRSSTTWYCLELMHARGSLGTQLSERQLRYHRQKGPDNSVRTTIWLFPEMHFQQSSIEKAASAMVSFGDDAVSLPRYSIDLPIESLPDSQYMLCQPPYIQVHNAIRSAERYFFHSGLSGDDDRTHRYYGPLYEDMDWHTDSELDMKRDAISAVMSYSIEELGARDIHVTSSYIPYEHFQCTRAFRDGFTYLEYLEVLREIILPIGSAALQRVRRRLCTKAEHRLPLHRWQLPFSSSATSDEREEPLHALFNGVPCGAVGFDFELAMGGLNMVSSSWPDWKSFSLCHTAPRFSPQLALPNGDVAHCHGYIMGTLWKDCLGQKWTGIRVFVVDALLTLGGSDKCYNFLFSPDSLTDRKARPVPTFEKRKLCGDLCPAFFTPGYRPPPTIGASIWKPSRKTPRQDTSTEEGFWEEMNRREVWDRSFEKRMRPLARETFPSEDNNEAIKALNAERAEEEERRQKWDETHATRLRVQDGPGLSTPN